LIFVFLTIFTASKFLSLNSFAINRSALAVDRYRSCSNILLRYEDDGALYSLYNIQTRISTDICLAQGSRGATPNGSLFPR